MSEKKLRKEINHIVQELVEKYKPEKVILFGSAAKESFKRDRSDLDFLIIKTDVPRLGRERVYELDKLINYNIASDFFVLTPKEIAKRSRLGDKFITTILQKGQVLYG